MKILEEKNWFVKTMGEGNRVAVLVPSVNVTKTSLRDWVKWRLRGRLCTKGENTVCSIGLPPAQRKREPPSRTRSLNPNAAATTPR